MSYFQKPTELTLMLAHGYYLFLLMLLVAGVKLARYYTRH